MINHPPSRAASSSDGVGGASASQKVRATASRASLAAPVAVACPTTAPWFPAVCATTTIGATAVGAAAASALAKRAPDGGAISILPPAASAAAAMRGAHVAGVGRAIGRGEHLDADWPRLLRRAIIGRDGIGAARHCDAGLACRAVDGIRGLPRERRARAVARADEQRRAAVGRQSARRPAVRSRIGDLVPLDGVGESRPLAAQRRQPAARHHQQARARRRRDGRLAQQRPDAARHRRRGRAAPPDRRRRRRAAAPAASSRTSAPPRCARRAEVRAGVDAGLDEHPRPRRRGRRHLAPQPRPGERQRHQRQQQAAQREEPRPLQLQPPRPARRRGGEQPHAAHPHAPAAPARQQVQHQRRQQPEEAEQP